VPEEKKKEPKSRRAGEPEEKERAREPESQRKKKEQKSQRAREPESQRKKIEPESQMRGGVCLARRVPPYRSRSFF
jgi:hypothetical protein